MLLKVMHFWGYTSLESLILPENIKTIYEGVFKHCPNLSEITMPMIDELEMLDGTMYDPYYGESLCPVMTDILGCESAKKVTILTSKSNYNEIPHKMFEGLTSLEEVVMSEDISGIGDSAFKGCSSLTKINLPEGLRYIGYYAFESCSGLAEIKLPSQLEEIGGFAFSGCSSLKEVVIPEKVRYVSYGAFSLCKNLSNVVIGENVIAIGDGLFKNCPNLREITMPMDFEVYFIDNEIEWYVEIINRPLISDILGCEAVEKVTITNGEEIPNYAFGGCASLKSVVFPSTVEIIQGKAFSDCASLESVTMPLYNVIIDTKEDGYFHSGHIWVSWDPDNEVRLVKLFDGMRDPDQYALRKLNITSMENSNILTTFIGYENGELVSEAAYGVPEKLFEGMSMLTDITFGDTVMSVSAGVFSDCTNLENLTFKSENVHIKEGALLETDAVVHCYEDSMVHQVCCKE